MADRVLILGASARAAAASARRAGLDPFAIDLFADADTKQLCDCLRCLPDRYPEGLFELAKQAPPMPWMYTGGLENYPELIDGLSLERSLWGNFGRLFAPVRDPFRLRDLLTGRDIPTLPIATAGEPLDSDRRWLRKPLSGAGGSGIRFAAESDSILTSTPRYYLQQFVGGRSMSAVFASLPWRNWLLGLTEQLVGTKWLHAEQFAYAGSIGPLTPDPSLTSWLSRVGVAVTQHALKWGVWGLDFVMTTDGPFVVEVNPRYPSSTEALDYGFGVSLVGVHRACGSFEENDSREDEEWNDPQEWCHSRTVGKAIYYAPHRLTFPASGPWYDSVRHAADVWRRPDFADVPHPGEVIEAGHPVLTILTEAGTEAECLSRLQSRAAKLDRLFGFPTPEGETCRP